MLVQDVRLMARQWEPDVNIVFHMLKDDTSGRAVPDMVAAVDRLLASRPEDAALTLNGNWLLLTRVAGAFEGTDRRGGTTTASTLVPPD
ncbi:SitI3 family protein [Micromonospora sp. DT228]|uniref:SitI3 family protein n=1 Tax=Micromonospora sp. DT228 TaxID=3393443 RepID=UPI003CF7016E